MRLGPTAVTQQQNYALISINNGYVGFNNQFPDSNDESLQTNVYSYHQVAQQATLTFRTFLPSPSEIAGDATHLRSVDFCFGLQDSTLGAAQPAFLSLTHASVLEFVESDATSPHGPKPADSLVTMVNRRLDITTNRTGKTGCKTLTMSPAPAIRAGGYLAMYLQAGFVAPYKADGSPFQGWIYLGRVTTTYGP